MKGEKVIAHVVLLALREEAVSMLERYVIYVAHKKKINA
jgi:hypothetical protein